ncbi:MAG TPA: GNAT family N-acetyltransferase [Acetobacteraceae bacterium]|nr:GNAT family N-acetyltransferase [Acetobacteraceae bacterium]
MTPASEPTVILGYFTLCATALQQGDVPEDARRRIPRYPLVSATLIGRLAIAREQQGRGLGSMLLVRAVRKAWESASTVGSCMVVVDAIDARAAAFYKAHGFTQLPDSARLVMPMLTIEKLIASSHV